MSSSAPSVSQLEPLVKRLQKIDTQLTGRTGTAAGSSLNDLVASLEAIASSLGSLHDLQSVLLRIEAADAKIRQQPVSAEYPHTMTKVLQRLEIVGPALAQIPAEYQQKPTATPAAKPTPTPTPTTSTPVPASTPASAPAPVKPASPAVKPTPAPAATPAVEPVKADGQKCQKTGADVCHCKSAPATTTSPTPAPASSVPTAGRCPKNGTLVCHCNDKPKSAAGAHAGSGSAYGVNKDAPTKPAASTPAAAPAPAPAAVAPKPATPAPVASTSTSTTSSSSSGPHYSHDQLKAGLPAGVDPKNKELHLEDHVFESLFKMSKEAWGKVAGWKKEIEKKKHGLF